MKQNSQRRDPGRPGAVTKDELQRGLAAETSAEAARDARMRTEASREGDEPILGSSAPRDIAGGQGEQKSRERGRLRSEAQNRTGGELFAGRDRDAGQEKGR